MEQDLTDVVLQAIAGSQGLGVAVARENGALAFVNNAFTRLGLDEKPEYLYDLLPEPVAREVKEVLSQHGTHHFSFSTDSVSYECIVSVTTVREESHHTIIAILVPQTDDALTLKAIGRVTGKYGHDFNNLIGSVLGATDLLEHKLRKIHGDDMPVERQLRLIKSAVGKAVALTGQMRGYARDEKYPHSELDLEPLLEGLVALVQESAAVAAEVFVEVKESLPVSGNEFQLSQALQSLLLNAVDAMKGSEEPCLAVLLSEVEVESDSDEIAAGRYMQVVIIDHGSGMSDEKIEAAFKPFYSTRSKEIGAGIGLGLPMARQVIRDHGGELCVQSLPETGTAVQVLLPVL